jgi:hypothetical protein
VRKEAYDLELLAHEISPGFYWQPTMMPAAFGYQTPATSAQSRAYVQTSPLGLAGYAPPPQPIESSEAEAATDAHQDAACGSCGAPLGPADRFCMRCGSAVL